MGVRNVVKAFEGEASQLRSKGDGLGLMEQGGIAGNVVGQSGTGL